MHSRYLSCMSSAIRFTAQSTSLRSDASGLWRQLSVSVWRIVRLELLVALAPARRDIAGIMHSSTNASCESTTDRSDASVGATASSGLAAQRSNDSCHQFLKFVCITTVPAIRPVENRQTECFHYC